MITTLAAAANDQDLTWPDIAGIALLVILLLGMMWIGMRN